MDTKRNSTMELHGNACRQVLSQCARQLDQWMLKHPYGEPVVRDFGLGDFYRIGEIEFWIANNIQVGYSAKFIFLFDGQTCPCHYHKLKHETFHVVKGCVEMSIDNVIRKLDQGHTIEVSMGMRHFFTGIGASLILEISTPSVRGDSYFDDTTIGLL